MKKRPADNGALPPQTHTKILVGSVLDTSDPDLEPRCKLCDGPYEVAYEGVRWCARCVAALLAGLDRRRAVELRLPPLDRAGAS
jgi:hypothetical protein